MNKDSKIYVAGHRGFVGGNLYRELLTRKFTNVCGYTRTQVNLMSAADTETLFKLQKFDYVFICAAKCGGVQANLDDPYSFLFDNLVIQNNLIHASIASHVKKVLFLGSSCIYPANYRQPLKEEYILQGPVEPTNEGYSIAKIAGLKLCEYANKLLGQTHNETYYATKFISLMPCNLYGPGDDFDLRNSHVMAALIRKFIEAKDSKASYVDMWGTGTAKRELLHINDLVDCMIWSMQNLDLTETFLNVGSGKDISIKELAEKISKVVDFDGDLLFDPTKPEGMKRKCLDVSRINALGWEDKTALSDGIKETVEYYRGLL